MMHRLHDWMHREPWSTWACVLIVVHTGVVALYLTGSAVSSVPFTREDVQTVISAPYLSTAHLIAALLLAVAIVSPRWRDIAAPVSFGLWLGTTLALYLAALVRVPPLAMWGPVLAFGFVLAALILMMQWDRGDDHGAR
jgi:hypothetical protein